MAAESDKILFKLGEVAEKLGVETHVLRFWEKEFPQVKPLKIGQRKRLYRQRDLETFRRIKQLLYEDRFTIAGAQKRLAGPDPDQGGLFDDPPAGETGPSPEVGRLQTLLDDTRRELLAIRDMLAARK